MKLIKITAAAAAAGLLLALCGCGETTDSSSQEISTVQPTSQAKERVKRDSATGTFSFDMDERFSKYEGAYPADFEFLLVDKEKDISAGVMEMTDLHITPEYYCENIKEHYEELYGTVTSTKSGQDGLPAHLLEAEFKDEEDGSDLLFYHKAIGFGNGDLLVWVVTAPKGAHEEAVRAVDDLMKGTTYNGTPLKTEPETFENEFFSITADKDWYYYSKGDSEATVRPNIASTAADHFGSVKLSAEESTSSAKELADKDAADFEANEKIINVEVTEGAEILGREAVSVSCVLTSDYMDLKRVTYYFVSDGKAYKLQILAPDDSFDEFGTESVLSTVTIK